MDHVWLVWGRTGLMGQEQLQCVCATKGDAYRIADGHPEWRCQAWVVNGQLLMNEPMRRPLTKDGLIESLARALYEGGYATTWQDAPGRIRAEVMTDAECAAVGAVEFVAAWMESRQSEYVMPDALRVWRSDMSA